MLKTIAIWKSIIFYDLYVHNANVTYGVYLRRTVLLTSRRRKYFLVFTRVNNSKRSLGNWIGKEKKDEKKVTTVPTTHPTNDQFCTLFLLQIWRKVSFFWRKFHKKLDDWIMQKKMSIRCRFLFRISCQY